MAHLLFYVLYVVRHVHESLTLYNAMDAFDARAQALL